MPIYRTKSQQVSALCWRPEASPTTYPDWFWWVFQRQPERFDAESGSLRVPTQRGERTALSGDWILREESGELDVCTDEDFQARYEWVDSDGH